MPPLPLLNFLSNIGEKSLSEWSAMEQALRACSEAAAKALHETALKPTRIALHSEGGLWHGRAVWLRTFFPIMQEKLSPWPAKNSAIEDAHLKTTPFKPLNEMPFELGEPIAVHGRTKLYAVRGRTLAVKVLLSDEHKERFYREAHFTKALAESGLFATDFPEPIGVVDGKQYLFWVPEGYYTYLHDPSLTAEQRRRAMRDLGKLIALGYHHETHRLIHNYCRTDGWPRKYLPLLAVETGVKVASLGAGQIKSAKDPFPNLGASGLRDVGDSERYVRAEYNLRMLSSDTRERPYPKVRLFLHMVSHAVTCDGLQLYMRCRHMSEKEFAQELIEGALALLEGVTGQERNEIFPLLKSVLPDMEMCARQLLFFGKFGGVGPFPQNLFPEDVPLTRGNGWNDPANIGPENGPLPASEWEAFHYAVCWCAGVLGAPHSKQSVDMKSGLEIQTC